MKKKFYFVLPLIFYVFLSACNGYKPIFASGNIEFDIANYTIQGDEILGKKIYLKLKNLSSTKKKTKNYKSLDFLINITKDKSPTSKDTAGKVLEYKIILNAQITVIDFVTDKTILEESFISSVTYKVQDQYSDTIKLENKTIENLLNKTLQEILIDLSRNISS